EAGADVLFVEAPESEDEVVAVAKAFPDVPLLLNWAEGGKTPPLSRERLQELGYSLILFPLTALFIATHAMRGELVQPPRPGSPPPIMASLPRFAVFPHTQGAAGSRKDRPGFCPLAPPPPPPPPPPPCRLFKAHPPAIPAMASAMRRRRRGSAC